VNKSPTIKYNSVRGILNNEVPHIETKEERKKNNAIFLNIYIYAITYNAIPNKKNYKQTRVKK